VIINAASRDVSTLGPASVFFVCVNKIDNLIDSFGLKCSGEMTLTDSGGQLLMVVTSGGIDAGIPDGLRPGERRSCFNLAGGGQLDTVTTNVGYDSEGVSDTGLKPLVGAGDWRDLA
jgi:hypothetical protein